MRLLVFGLGKSSQTRKVVWAVASILAIVLGCAWFTPMARGIFVLSDRDSALAWFLAFDGLSLIFQALLAFGLPRIGGPLLSLTSLSALAFLWPATRDPAFTSVGVRLIYGPALILGLAITWSVFAPLGRRRTLVGGRP